MILNKEFPNQSDINAFIKKAQVCRLGIYNGKAPYVIPLSFGFCNNVLYFHSGPMGQKLSLLKDNPNVGFEFDTVIEVIAAENPCSWDIKYQSVIGTGKTVFIENPDDKIHALGMIVAQYSDKALHVSETKAKAAIVFKIEIENMTWKQNLV